MELIFNTKTYKTKVSKYATIYSNDPATSTTKIHLSANIYASTDSGLPFSFSPEKVNLTQDEKKGKIVLGNKGESKIWIESLDAFPPGLNVDIKNDDPKPGQETELRFEWKNDFEKENVERSITFLAHGEKADSVRFTIPYVLQGTDPAPAANVTKRRPKSATSSASSRPGTVRKSPSRRVSTKAIDPKSTGDTDVEKSGAESDPNQ